MKSKKLYAAGLIALLTLMFTLSSCEKDNLTLLTDGTWKFSNMTTNSTDPSVKSIVAFAKALMTDATIRFYEDGNYELRTPLSPDAVTGTWELIGSTQLIMTPTGDVGSTSSIDKLTKSEFDMIETWLDQSGATYSTTTSWKR